MIITLTGPSGSGKTTILRKIMEMDEFKSFPELVSCTSREKRDGEVEGVDYYFVDRETFLSLDMVEKAEYCNCMYGLSKEEAENKLKNNKICFSIVDKNGVINLQNAFPNDVKSIFIKVDDNELKERLIKRDGKEKAQIRIDFMNKNNENTFDDKLFSFEVENKNGTFDNTINDISAFIKQFI